MGIATVFYRKYDTPFALIILMCNQTTYSLTYFTYLVLRYVSTHCDRENIILALHVLMCRTRNCQPQTQY